MRSESEMREWIAEKEEEYRDDREVLESIDELSPNQQLRSYHLAYLSSVIVATYRLQLGDESDSCHWFERAANHTRQRGLTAIAHKDDLERRDVISASKKLTNGILCAILSDSDECIEETATAILELDDSFRDLLEEEGGSVLSYDESELLAAISQSRDDAARQAIDRIRSFASEPNFDEQHSGVPAGHSGPLADGCEGLLNGDGEVVTEAIKAMLNAHESNIDGDPRGHSEIMDHTAAAVLVLARDRGLDVTVESEYTPDALFEDE